MKIQEIIDADRQTLDELPYGVIIVDGKGTILEYNEYEGRLAGRSRDDVLGKNFFTDVAPCTNVREFKGKLDASLGSEFHYEGFDFQFKFPDRTIPVSITLYSESENQIVIKVSRVN